MSQSVAFLLSAIWALLALYLPWRWMIPISLAMLNVWCFVSLPLDLAFVSSVVSWTIPGFFYLFHVINAE